MIWNVSSVIQSVATSRHIAASTSRRWDRWTIHSTISMTIMPALFSSVSEEWPTPPAFFAKLNRRYRFTLDPCATSDNAKCPLYFTKEQDGENCSMTAKFKVADLPLEADADLSVRAHNQHSGPGPLHTWESPDWSILDDRRGELPDFPLDCLGKKVAVETPST
jgi:hypothetical protein